MNPLLIGSVFIAIATSLPEFFISITATLSGEHDIVVGNAIGSTAFNIFAVVAFYLFVRKSQFTWKNLFFILCTLILFLFSLNNNINWLEGLVLILIYLLFLLLNLSHKSGEACQREKGDLTKIIVFFAFGAAILALGAYLCCYFVENLAIILNIPTGIIAGTFISVGTGAPELFTAISAIKKKELNFAIGNVIGSCIFNWTILFAIPAISSSGLFISNVYLFLSIPFILLASLLSLLPKKYGGYALLILYSIYLFFLCF
jgi:cation:H+ antiporter